jgi:hypothetical protein
MATDDLDRSARRRRLVGGGLVAAFAAVLVAIVFVRSTGEKVLNENGDTLVLVGRGATPSDAEQVDAFVADVEGCLGVTDRRGSEPRVVVWPHGTTIETPVPLRVTVDGETYAVGQGISLRGSVTTLDASSYFYDKVPAGCRTAEALVVGDE